MLYIKDMVKEVEWPYISTGVNARIGEEMEKYLH